MTALGTTANSMSEISPAHSMKLLVVKVLQSALSTTTGVNPADTFTVNLANFGATTLWAHNGVCHTTLNSVIIREDASVASAGTTYTFTVGGGETATATAASSKTRVYTLLVS